MAKPSKEPCKKEACDIQACLSKNNFLPQRSWNQVLKQRVPKGDRTASILLREMQLRLHPLCFCVCSLKANSQVTLMDLRSH
ncbi:uncharacterized protein LOC110417706 isoform X1 [Herrania umbratica]|uniref:Uncharacterized protein LOC110417706 isoform X1 n=1 Tax=Herrania umbratica TaxID=108875 RepID=A0A6J1AF80_9ROSI|nr:uncharacterized protein LOC110417706 isoform X1 [Herrania umbratica]